MSLERNQRIIDQLILGAEVTATGISKGLSIDETLEQLGVTKEQYQIRENQIRQAQQIAGDPFEPQQLIRQYQNVISDDEPYPDPFGEAEQVIRDDSGRVIERRRPQDDNQSYDRQEKVRQDVLGEDFLADAEIAQQKDARARGRQQQSELKGGRGLQVREGAGGNAGAQDALRRLQALEQFGGRGELLFSPSELAEIERLKGRLVGGDGGRGANAQDRREAQRAAREERVRFNTPEALEVREANDNKAQAKANKIAEERFQRGGKGAAADKNIERIAEIRRLGPGGAFKPMEQAQVIRTTPQEEFPEAVRVVDARQLNPGRETLGYLDPGNVPTRRGQVAKNAFLGEQNTADTANELNAPLPRGQEWMQRNLPAFGSEGDYPSVDIANVGRTFGERVQRLGIPNIPSQIRNIEELDSAVDLILADAAQSGRKLYRFDEEMGRNVFSTDPGIDEVLNLLRYNNREKQELANAMLQIKAGESRGINAARYQGFRNREDITPTAPVAFDVGRMRPDGGTPLALIKGERVGRGKKQKNVAAELRGLDGQAVVDALKARGEFDTEVDLGNGRKGRVILPNAVAEINAAAAGRADAQKPLYGALAAEGAPRAAFIRGDMRGKSMEEMIKRFGPENAKIAMEVENRYLQGEEQRAERQKPQSDTYAQQQRALDDEFKARGYNAEYEFELDERQKMIDLIKGGKLSVPSDAAFGGAKQIPRKQLQKPSERTERLLSIGDDIVRKLSPGQEIQAATTPASIAPSPGDMTGNQAAPAADAGRGGWMGGGGKGRIVNPFEPDPEPEERRIPTSSYMSEPDGPSSSVGEERTRRAVVGQMKQNRRNRRIGYGAGGAGAALAGLTALMGRDREEEEEYAR